MGRPYFTPGFVARRRRCAPGIDSSSRLAGREIRLVRTGTFRLETTLGYPATPEQIAARLQLLRSDPQCAVFVAEADASGIVVGWIHVCAVLRLESAACAEIGGLVIAESARGCGVGRTLVAAAEAWAVTQGLPEIKVRSNVVRTEAHRFYERLDYQRRKTQAVFSKPVGPQSPA